MFGVAAYHEGQCKRRGMKCGRTGAARIFVSCRRDDSGGWVRGLHDRLVEHFGERRVCIDLQDISPGADFVTTLQRSLSETRDVLVIIGKSRLNFAASDGSPRLDDSDDWMRLELNAAIASGKRIIHVLVDGADMPSAELLPGDIPPLSRHQTFRLYPDHFASGVKLWVQGIEADSG